MVVALGLHLAPCLETTEYRLAVDAVEQECLCVNTIPYNCPYLLIVWYIHVCNTHYIVNIPYNDHHAHLPQVVLQVVTCLTLVVAPSQATHNYKIF